MARIGRKRRLHDGFGVKRGAQTQHRLVAIVHQLNAATKSHVTRVAFVSSRYLGLLTLSSVPSASADIECIREIICGPCASNVWSVKSTLTLDSCAEGRAET